jgi:hypothetical protein
MGTLVSSNTTPTSAETVDLRWTPCAFPLLRLPSPHLQFAVFNVSSLTELRTSRTITVIIRGRFADFTQPATRIGTSVLA